MYTQLGLFIDGEWIYDADVLEAVIDPATGEALGHLPHASGADLDRALAAADRAFASWRKVSAYDRARILRDAADIVRKRRDTIARIMTLEQGKVLTESRAEVDAAADIIEWAAEEGRRAYGRVIPGRSDNIRQLMIQEPVGVAAGFTPWNFPATTPARKLATALAAGCTVIVKASEETPGTAVEILRAFEEAGIPKGAANLVFGIPAEVSGHLINSPIVRKISFTGSVPIGRHLATLAAGGLKRATLELGGHSPVLVFDDADPVAAAKTLVAGKFRNAGQVCIAPTRFFVQRGIEKPFLDAFLAETARIRLGSGLIPETTMGPLANARRVSAMEAFVDDCRTRGADVLCGGSRSGNAGFFFEPTVVCGLSDDSRVMTEEPFGPIAPLVAFDSFDEVIGRANALPFGLAAYVFTKSTQTALAASAALEAGMVAVNSLSLALTETPMGGVKDSGSGHEGGVEGLEGYTVKKYVSLT
ncbi:Betaine-aldehyde dehydrogenase [Ancylobacter novellus DSM 506]|uniref:Betaine-aldehyde dehydrogenase n=1 Tax=Ancylobacter novellus (strain ATCC 8093 / DSM 506 / JCM 20403 / CCM 1077 / IAM 12100 / NBRC 12443 / NCIMB 10456) TaxID=639283 RepID=D7A2Q9_ANCN5|nr:NAD-dependent succinate-semialdehyde dehydrogenase [Ancylobacter novellus]ADH91589.1 Betaine-aldehyde dehydrogenase [Ancylobacter novellus DSM 506]